MRSSKAELLLHPVRIRIIQALMGGRHLTPQQIAAAMPDVPQATLYRHLNKLAQGGILLVAAKRQVRGALEKIYALPNHAANLELAELAGASREDHMHYFTSFVATLLGDFARYLQREKIDMVADGVGYRQVALYLNDEEFTQMGDCSECSAAAISGLWPCVYPAAANMYLDCDAGRRAGRQEYGER